MDARFIGTLAIPGSPASGGGDARPGDRTTFLQIRESVTTSCINRIEAVLYAYLDNEMVAALDFTRMDDNVRINMVFVKPGFRRRGIGSALARHMATQHPGAKISLASRKCDPTLP